MGIETIVALAALGSAGASVATVATQPKKPGVDPNVAKAQQEQKDKLAREEAREKKEKRSRDEVFASNQGRRGRGTLFQATGEKGVPKQLLGE